MFVLFREALNCGEVQGPINKEPEEKLDPSVKQQQPSGIRRLYVFDSNNYFVVVVDVKLEDLNCTIADLYNLKNHHSFDLPGASQYEFTEADDEDVDVDEYFDDGIGEFLPTPTPAHNSDTTWYSNLILNALLVSKVFCDTTQCHTMSDKKSLSESSSSSSAISSASLSRSSSSEKFEISKEAISSSASILSVTSASSSSLSPHLAPTSFDSLFNLSCSVSTSSSSSLTTSFARKASSGYSSSCSTTPPSISSSSSFSFRETSHSPSDRLESLGENSNTLFVKFLLLNLFYLIICLCMNKLLLAVLRLLLRILWNLFVFSFFALATVLVTCSCMYILRSLRRRQRERHTNLNFSKLTGNSQVKPYRSNVLL